MEIALVALSIISISFFMGLLFAVNRLRTVSEGFSKLFITYNAMREALESSVNGSPDEIHKENFIKFLSDSREWAFGYIEDVQVGLKKFVEQVQPEIDYYNKYGMVVEGMISPHDKALKKISEEFEELKKLLPEDTNDRR